MIEFLESPACNAAEQCQESRKKEPHGVPRMNGIQYVIEVIETSTKDCTIKVIENVHKDLSNKVKGDRSLF